MKIKGLFVPFFWEVGELIPSVIGNESGGRRSEAVEADAI